MIHTEHNVAGHIQEAENSTIYFFLFRNVKYQTFNAPMPLTLKRRFTMPRGGARPNSGPKPGSKQIMTALAQAEAKLAGLLPHEWLLKVVRGEPIEQHYVVDVIDKKTGVVIGEEVHSKMVYPSLDMRADAAKAAAPYYAPRLATQVITLRGREDVLNQLTDEQIDAAIVELASDLKKPAGKRNGNKS